MKKILLLLTFALIFLGAGCYNTQPIPQNKPINLVPVAPQENIPETVPQESDASLPATQSNTNDLITPSAPEPVPAPVPQTKQQTTAPITETAPISEPEEKTVKVEESLPVKKSSTGICHAPGTTYYNRTTNYTPYDTIQECLDSGGRLPLK